jgi:hypothetical protein
MYCYLCKLKVEGNYNKILINDGSVINVCSKCNEDIYLDGERYNVDVMIVPITDASFKFTYEKKLYIKPSRYVQKDPKFIAFYRIGNIGAITHIAKVIKIQKDVERKELINRYNIGDFGKWSNEEIYKVYLLENVLELKNKIIKKNAQPIQNRVYKSFKKFCNAKTIEDLK